ncbi:hypothetical protein ACQJBY_016038 [Aegilops geniculata]
MSFLELLCGQYFLFFSFPIHPAMCLMFHLSLQHLSFLLSHPRHHLHVVSLPSGVRPITCKWVYKIKTRSDGFLERDKARLVARGFQQEQGHDYDETFAPVAHMTTVRTLLAVASVRHWSISQLDVRTLFSMASCVRRFICSHHRGTMLLMVWSVDFAAPSMALNRPLAPGSSVSPLW